MRRQIKRHAAVILQSAVLLTFVICAGCQNHSVQRAAAIRRDTSLSCSQATSNRCAIPSELKDLSHSVHQQGLGAHYVSILDVGEEALLARIHLIRAARESIDLQTFIWDDDEVGQMVFWEMLQAARRGVRVRIILDQIGTYVSIPMMARMATAHENIDIQFFRPVMQRAGKNPINTISTLITNPNSIMKRMHNKVFVIDGQIGIVGGRNIQNAYFDFDSDFCFKDLDLLVVGPEASSMERSFNKYWEHHLTRPALELPDIAAEAVKLHSSDQPLYFESPQTPELIALQQKANEPWVVTEHLTAQLQPVSQLEYVADPPNKWNLFDKEHRWNSTRHVEELVSNAQYEILMQTPYLIQDRKGFMDLKRLRKKRPDMRIVLSTNSLASTDMFYVYAMCFKQRQFYLDTAKANLYEFKPVPDDVQTMIPRYRHLVNQFNNGKTADLLEDQVLAPNIARPRLVLHAKFLIVDESVALVGSHNFDPRAKKLNTESAVIIRDPQFAASLKQLFERDTAPQNSWVVARRQKVPLVGNISELVAAISSSLPFFDIWPLEYSTNFELKDGFEPLTLGHPDFYKHYRDVGIFPQMGMTYQDLGTRFVKAFGGLFRDIM